MDNSAFFVTKKVALEDYINKFKSQRNVFLAVNVIVSIFLCAFLAFAFFIFSHDIKWLQLNCNGIIVLWIAVGLSIVGQVWIVFRTFQQLMRYQTCIRRLNMLLFKISIQKNVSEEEILKEIQSVLRIFEMKSNIELL